MRKWRNKLIFKSIDEFDEIERFDLHKELENILPSFIIYLPSELHSDWIKRWKNKEDSLFHPKNLISGDLIKEHLDISIFFRLNLCSYPSHLHYRYLY